MTRTIAVAKNLAQEAMEWIERRLEGMPNWRAGLLVSVLCVSTCFLFYSPALWIPRHDDNRHWDFVRQAADPLTRDLHEPILAYRPIHPLIMHLLGVHDITTVQLFPIAYSLGFVWLLYMFMRRHTTPAVAAAFCAALATTEVLQVGTFWLGLPDTLCWCIALLVLLANSAYPSILLIPLGLLTDERFVLTIPFLVFVRLALLKQRPLAKWIEEGLAPLLGVVAAFTARHALVAGWIGPGIEVPAVYQMLMDRLLSLVSPHVVDKPYAVPLAIFFSYRFAWLFPIFAVRECKDRDSRVVRITATLCVVACAYAIFIGGDWTRGFAYIFPLFILAFLYLYARAPVASGQLALIVMALNLGTPQFNIDWAPGRTGLVHPMPLALLRRYVDPHRLLH
jgi:hypothetical protein